jgi:hypothetical protein
MKPPSKSAAMETIRAGFIELLNDPGVTDRARLRQLEQLSEEVEGFIFEFPPSSQNRDHGAAIHHGYEFGALPTEVP